MMSKLTWICFIFIQNNRLQKNFVHSLKKKKKKEQQLRNFFCDDVFWSLINGNNA